VSGGAGSTAGGVDGLGGETGKVGGVGLHGRWMVPA
jgi:hypothetical protein